MISRLLATAAVVVCLFNGSPAHAESSLGHTVDDKADIIYGRGDAPHEMRMYFSPGCLPCLRTFYHLKVHLHTYYLSAGHMRLVLRDVPQFVSQHGGNTDEESTRQALRTSFTLGLFMRCHFRHGGTERYFRALSSLSFAVMAQNKDHAEEISRWPQVSPELLDKIYARINEDGLGLTMTEEQACEQTDFRRSADDAFRNNFKAFQTLSAAEGRATAIPAYIIDGHWLRTEKQTPLTLSNSVRAYLKERILD